MIPAAAACAGGIKIEGFRDTCLWASMIPSRMVCPRVPDLLYRKDGLDRVPWSGVADVCYHRRPAALGGSGCHGGQADERIIAHWGEGFQCHVARALNGPFVVLFEQDRTDETELPHLGKYPPPRSVA
jgi:hypothetical protein